MELKIKITIWILSFLTGAFGILMGVAPKNHPLEITSKWGLTILLLVIFQLLKSL